VAPFRTRRTSYIPSPESDAAFGNSRRPLISYSTKVEVKRLAMLTSGFGLARTLAACGPATVLHTPTATQTLTTPSRSPATPTQAVVIHTLAPSPVLWMPLTGLGDQIWQFDEGGGTQIRSPVGSSYGYSQQAHRILMAAAFSDHGAGPTPVTVGDLSILGLASGQVSTIFTDDVVEALLAPNGSDIAYILATAGTYELHSRAESGKDRVPASDVAFTWSIAPSGEAVAFRRESRYGLGGTPGLYVVSVFAGVEVQVSDADKAANARTTEVPCWSADSSQLVLPQWAAVDASPRLILANADGSWG
jgi:hypothetical protein